MKLSIVASMYRSVPYIAAFHARISATARACVGEDYEIVLINDGSPDESLQHALVLASTDPHLVVIELSRNFGHHRAMMTGLEESRGAHVFLTDIDLEEAPENLQLFWDYAVANPGVDVVIGETSLKQGSYLKRCLSGAFYLLFNFLSPIRISNREMVSRLMKRGYVDALLSYRERELFFPGIWAHAGFTQHYVPAEKIFDGNSTYTLRRRIAMAIEAITSFSSRPLMLIFYTGCLFSVGSALFILYLVAKHFLYGGTVVGWASLVAFQFFIGGIIIFSLGVVGIYVAKIYTEVKQRPTSIIKQRYRHSHD